MELSDKHLSQATDSATLIESLWQIWAVPVLLKETVLFRRFSVGQMRARRLLKVLIVLKES